MQNKRAAHVQKFLENPTWLGRAEDLEQQFKNLWPFLKQYSDTFDAHVWFDSPQMGQAALI